jgi:hypothetical protein
MYKKSWQVIIDHDRKTYEVVGQESNTDSFMNRVMAWQKVGLNVSATTPPVTNQLVHKSQFRMVGYQVEEGLHERLVLEHRKRLADSIGVWDEGTE